MTLTLSKDEAKGYLLGLLRSYRYLKTIPISEDNNELNDIKIKLLTDIISVGIKLNIIKNKNLLNDILYIKSASDIEKYNSEIKNLLDEKHTFKTVC